MSTLRDQPNLENLKKQAKTLLRDAHAGDRSALGRFAALPAFAGLAGDEPPARELALHDAQSVVARELSFPSWNALREKWKPEPSRLAKGSDLELTYGGNRGFTLWLQAAEPQSATPVTAVRQFKI